MLLRLQDKHAKSEATATSTNSAEEIESVNAELAKLEASLEKEEAELESIRDGLKEKTQGFSAAIEQKQKELQPWVAKISERQAARDVAQEERDLLAGRTETVKKSSEEAKQALASLEEDNAAKVSSGAWHRSGSSSMDQITDRGSVPVFSARGAPVPQEREG